MPRFAANLSMMFTEWAFLDRFAAAADAGFTAVEYLFPYDHRPDEIAKRLSANGLTQVLFNLSPGDWAAGERGFAACPGRQAAFRDTVATAFPYIVATNVRRIHAMSGCADPTDPKLRDLYLENLCWAADILARHDVELLIEPINPRDMPGYFLRDFDLAGEILSAAARSNLRLQFDIYHRQVLRGDVATALRELMPLIGHIQIAGVPQRHEPDLGELNYAFLFGEIDRLNYLGFIGCEYRPRAGTIEGLGWLRRMTR
ncbi:2-oxo-tetronate isomerase [Dongia soli]|uniref:2-oxo-tetronate isomerase n=1 Tax=Dongia soli TaxID=600628 RepID=A0ABU5EEC4_9PROT|nr:2-oxo-tetronate isomerase [Dongia soli]MDY0884184.1 2-oxo-tetronate isomerase [Dongia soli]